jgi:hypothetical protein
MNEPEKLMPPHGGYRHLKSFQVSQLVYDVTVRFCDRYYFLNSKSTGSPEAESFVIQHWNMPGSACQRPFAS